MDAQIRAMRKGRKIQKLDVMSIPMKITARVVWVTSRETGIFVFICAFLLRCCGSFASFHEPACSSDIADLLRPLTAYWNSFSRNNRSAIMLM
jgi:uncharacterized protein CbrC (UPF0167 family)